MTMNIFQRMNLIMQDVRALPKNEVNTHFRFNFRGIDAVMNAVGPVLRKHGVIAMPVVEELQHERVQVKNGFAAAVRVKMTVRFFGLEGDSMQATVWGEAMDNGDKATAKAHSVAFRTALLQALCLPTDEPDPDHYVYERAGGGAPQQPQQPEPVVMPDGWREKLQAATQASDLQLMAKMLDFAKRSSDIVAIEVIEGAIKWVSAAEA